MRQSRESNVSTAIRQTMCSSELSSANAKNIQKADFTIKLANTLIEREAVFRLGYRVYLEKGFTKENTNQWLIQNYDFYEQTAILIVQDKNKNVAGSLTLVFEEDGKLPVEKIYKEELNDLRAKGEKLLEVSRLAISPDYRNAKEILQLLYNYMLIYAYHIKKYDAMVIEVNPRHKNYYKLLLKYDEIGQEKSCPLVENAPAVLLHLPLNRYQSEIIKCAKMPDHSKKERSLYPYFLNPQQEMLVAHYLEKQFKPMCAEERIYFGFSESGMNRVICVENQLIKGE